MLRQALLALTAAGTLALAAGFDANACCMVPVTYEGAIGQSAQEAVIFHDQGREELLLRINYRITGKAMPSYFAWVVTVPHEPDAYAVADPKLFKEVFDWANPLVAPPTRDLLHDSLRPDAPAAPQGLEFGKAVKVGPYDIQPVRALGQEALEGLNAWLGKNGFPTEDPGHMAYFVAQKFTFLCVKVVPPEGEKTVDAAGGLPPLHLSFKSETPYYPLRFSSRQGIFDVNLTVLTKDDFDYEASGEMLKRLRADPMPLRNVKVEPAGFPETLKQVLAKSRFKGDKAPWRLNVLRGRRVNEGNAIAGWATDIFFKTKA